MDFSEAWVLVTLGKRVRRRAWRPRASISAKDGDRFVTMTVHFKELDRDDFVKEWQPYVYDFIEQDWEEVEDFPTKPPATPKRISRYHREPVI